MKITKLVLDFKKKGIFFKVIGGELSILSNGDIKPTEKEIALIKENKKEIIEILSKFVDKKNHIPHKTENNIISKAIATQIGLWLNESKLGKTDRYNLYLCLKISGKPDQKILKKVILEIVFENNILRSQFSENQGSLDVSIQSTTNTNINNLFEVITDNENSYSEDIISQKINEICSKPLSILDEILIKFHLIEFSNKCYFVVKMHHAISDGWSLGILFNELLYKYSLYFQEKVPQKNRRLTYGDYIRWYDDFKISNDYQKQLSFWKKKWEQSFNGILNQNQISSKTCQIKKYSFTISNELDSELLFIAQKYESSIFTITFSIFSIVISLIFGKKRVSLLSPVANRTRGNFQTIIGYMVNTLPFIFDVESQMTLRKYMEHSIDNIREIISNQEILLQDLLEIFNDQSYIQDAILFIYQDGKQFQSQHEFGTNKVIVEDIIGKKDIDQNLIFICRKEKNNFKFIIEYNEENIKENYIHKIEELWVKIISNFLKYQEKKIHDISRHDKKRYQYIKHVLSGESKINFTFIPIIERFINVVNDYQEKYAIVEKSCQISYCELDKKSAYLAAYLLSKQATYQQKVVVLLPRGIYSVISLLGVFRSRNVYIPIDTDNSSERLEHYFSSIEIDKIITTQAYCELLEIEKYKDKLIIIDQFNFNRKQEKEISKFPVIKETDIAYIILTSGTTGQAKAVEVSHRGIENLISSFEKYITTPPKISTYCISPSFDASILEVFLSLITGSTLFAFSKDEIISAYPLENFIKDNEVDICILTSSLLENLSNKHKISNLLIIGGDACTDRLISKYHKCCNFLINQYGPTENTVCATYDVCQPDNPVSIGRPVSNILAYVIDDNLNLVDIDEIGELCLGGVGVAKGYLNLDFETQEKFIDLPFESGESVRVYRTGDFVKWGNDGKLYFQGRRDNQIKYHGYRIELDEIQVAIRALAGIQDAVVDFTNLASNKILCAYYISNSDMNNSEIKKNLLNTIPSYMVPQYFFRISKIPININGKIDFSKLRQHLMKYLSTFSEINNSVTADKIPDKFIKIVSDVIDVPANNISLDDNFFEIGGNSLKVMKLLFSIYQEYNIQIKPREIFDKKTIFEIKQLLDRERTFTTDIIKAEKDRIDFYLSENQKRLFYLFDKDKNLINQYNVPIVLKFNGKLDEEKIIESINLTLSNHIVFNIVFTKTQNGEIRQKIKKINNKNITVKSISKLELLGRIEQDLEYQFELINGKLYKANLYKIGEQEYVLSLIINHIICDGWSVGLIYKELSDRYNQPSNPEIDLKQDFNFLDYVCNEKILIEDQYVDKWVDHLEYCEELPIEKMYRFDRSGSHEKKGETVIKQFLKASIIKKNYSINVDYYFFFACYFILMSRYCDAKKFAIGTPVANRDIRQFHNSIGFYANTVAINSDCILAESFEESINFLKKSFESLREYQNIPINYIIEKLNRKFGNNIPLFNTMFVYTEKGDVEQLSLGAVNVESFMDSEYKSVKFPLVLSILEDEDQYQIKFEYDNSLFEKDFIENISTAYLELVNNAANDPSSDFKKIELLTQLDKGAYHNCNVQKELVNSENGDLNNCLESVLIKYKNKIAITHNNRTISFGQLSELINKYYNLLLDKSEAEITGKIIAVALTPSIEMIAILLAILKLKGVYLPIDPKIPNSRYEFILRDSKAVYVIREGIQDGNKIFSTSEQLDGNNYLNRLKIKNSEVIADSEISLNNAMYVIYTSGTTGNPKGVVVSDTGFLNMINQQIQIFSCCESSCVVQQAAIGFDASLSEIFMSLLSGANLVLCDEVIKKDLKALQKFYVENKITIATFTPSLFKHIEYNCNYFFKTIILAGEKLPKSSHTKWLNNVKIFNAYGPTENSVCSSIKEISDYDVFDNIGKPLKNVNYLILDKNLHLVPVGVTGKLYVLGKGLANGYLNNAKLTSNKFIKIPELCNNYTSYPLMYDTGDLVKIDFDGDVYFQGRDDHQIKIRGYRVELDEITSVAKTVSGVKDAVAIVTDRGDFKNIVLFYESENKISEEQITSALKNILPIYIMPNIIKHYVKFPITPNGKVDLNALRENIDINSNTNFEIQNAVQKEIVDTFKEVMDCKKVRLNNNFYELGGDSLLAMTIIYRLNNQYNLKLKSNDLLSRPLLREFIDYLITCVPHSDKNLKTIRKYKSYPLTKSQKLIWFAQKFSPKGKTAYNIPIIVSLDNSINIELFSKIIECLIYQHEIFSLQIDFSKNEPSNQIIKKVKKYKIEKIFLENENIQSYINNFIHSTNYFLDQYLYDIKIIDSCDGYIFIAKFHHIIFDGISVQSFMRQLGKRYQSGDISVHNNEYDFMDYIINQENTTHQINKNANNYWQNRLKGDLDLSRSNEISHALKSIDKAEVTLFKCPSDLFEKVLSQSIICQVSVNTFLMSVFGLLLYKMTRTDKFVIGLPYANREDSAFKDTLGYFVNMIPFGFDIKKNDTVYSFLKLVQKNFLSDLENLDDSLNSLYQSENKNNKGNPLFNIVFSYQEKPSDELVFSKKMDLLTDKFKSEISKFDLSFFVINQHNNISISIEYSAHLFERDYIENMNRSYITLLENILLDPHQKIFQVNTISHNQKNTLINKFSRFDSLTYSLDKNIFQIFELIVSKYPNKIAIHSDNGSISYDELNKKANILARKLLFYKESHHARNNLIAILFDKGIDLIIAMIAINKSGCAYLPLDPNNPSVRLKYILDDAKPKVMLTQKKYKHLKKDLLINIFIFDDAFNSNDSLLDTNLDIKMVSTDLMYVIYTSGTTGNPKGVMVEQKSIPRLFKNSNICKISEETNVLQTANISFDVSVYDIWGPLLNGATLILTDISNILDSVALKNILDKFNVNFMWLTTSLFNGIFANSPDVFRNLSTLIIGGEALNRNVINDMFENSYNPQTVINGYGPTEAAVFALTYKFEHAIKQSTVPIGFPVTGTYCYVLDQDLQFCSINTVGELFIGGDALARGYINNPLLTETKFIDDPYKRGRKLYRTGDMVYWDKKGCMYYVGRADDQIKIRGHRVELSEIEETLLSCPNVKQSCVIVKMLKQQKHLICYYTSTDIDEPVDSTVINNYLVNSLPEYMLPSQYINLNALPLLDSGKIDKKYLANLAVDIKPSSNNTLPRNSFEKSLMTAFTNVLDMQEIGIDDDFFRLGGNSILAISCHSHICKMLNVDFDIEVILKERTIRKISEYLLGNQGGQLNSLQPLVPLQNANSKLSFYCIHHDAGSAYSFALLSTFFKDKYNFFGLQCPSFYSDDFQIDSFKDLAQLYWTEIKKNQQMEPYFIGGFCVGGIIAYEVVKLAKNENKKVCLFLIDSIPEIPESRLNLILKKIVGKTDKVANTRRLIVELWKNHSVSTIDENIFMYKAEKELAGYIRPLSLYNGWGCYLKKKKTRVVKVPGDHLSIINDVADTRALAQCILNDLDQITGGYCDK